MHILFGSAQLSEKGEIKKLRTRWWDERDECKEKRKPPKTGTLSLELHNVAGVFIILFAGMATSFLMLLVERRCGNLAEILGRRGVGWMIHMYLFLRGIIVH